MEEWVILSLSPRPVAHTKLDLTTEIVSKISAWTIAKPATKLLQRDECDTEFDSPSVNLAGVWQSNFLLPGSRCDRKLN